MAQLVGQRGELGDLALGGGELGGDEVVEALLDRTATLAVPDPDEVGDLLEGAAELLGPSDERQAGEGVVVVEPVAGVGAGRRDDQSDALVVAQRRGAEPAASADSPIV